MRHFLFVLLSLVSVIANAHTSIWSGSKDIDWNTGTYLQISADKFSSVNVADQIKLTFTTTGAPASWPQIALYNGSWKQLPGCGNAQLSNGTSNYGLTSYSYSITNDMLSNLQSGGVIVTGAGYTLTEITIVKGPGSAGYENAVWIGSVDATQSWVAQSVPSSSFANAKKGQYLRLYYDDLKSGAMHTIVDSNWKAIEGYGFYNMSGVYYQYTIDDVLLNTMKGGIIINGTGYRLTHIDIVDPGTLQTLTASVPLTDGWLFKDKKPSITVNITNPYDHSVDAELTLMVKTDKMEAYKTLTQKATIAAGASEGITLSFDAEPGFYVVTPLLNGDPVYTAVNINGSEKASAFVIGVNPEQIVSTPDMQADFADFWSNTKAELAKIDAEFSLTEIPSKSTAKRKVYLLEYKSLPDKDGQTAIARGYYAEPVGAGTYPAIIHYSGYDSGDYDPWCPGGNDSPGYAELVLSTRGQLVNNRSPYTNTYGDWFQYGFGDKDAYYYRGAFMDAVRAIEFVAGREKVDSRNIFAEGASQGGALTIAAAALTDIPLCAIAPSIPFLGDFPDYFQISSWPAYPARQQQAALGMTDAEMYRFLSYFDTKNLATMIACPVIQNMSLQDNVCPPHTNIAPYNNLNAGVEKEISYNATLMHATPSSWWNTYHDFFTKHMVTDGVSEVTTSNAAIKDKAYLLTGEAVSLRSIKKGIYIVNGRKVAITR